MPKKQTVFSISAYETFVAGRREDGAHARSARVLTQDLLVLAPAINRCVPCFKVGGHAFKLYLKSRQVAKLTDTRVPKRCIRRRVNVNRLCKQEAIIP